VFDEKALDRLAESIKRSGMMQPVVLRSARPAGGGSGGGVKYELVAGERRWRAAKLAGLARVPALVRELSDEEAAEWGLVENVQREDLNPMERAWAFRALIEQFSLTHAQIAERVGVDRSTVANTVRLTELEPLIQEMVTEGTLKEGHGRALLALAGGAKRVEMAKKAAAEGWSVRQVERAVAAAALEAMHQGISSAKRMAEAAAELTAGLSPAKLARLDLERQLSEHLGTKVTITTDRGGEKGKLTLEFYGLDHFDGLLAKFGFRAR
jgi:ParB family chromosome partitioning protein